LTQQKVNIARTSRQLGKAGGGAGGPGWMIAGACVSSYQFEFTLHIYLAIQLHWQSNFTDFFSCDIF